MSKVFDIFRDAVSQLSKTYNELQLSEQVQQARFLPRPSYPPDVSRPERLEFQGRVKFGNNAVPAVTCTLYNAKYNGKSAIVKFCEAYHEEAHRMLSKARLAPELYFFTRLCGNVYMVVMENVGKETAHSKFYKNDLPEAVVGDVRAALKLLHDNDLVFGDVRRPNIMVRETDDGFRALLVDFDWVGKAGEARYPALLNMEDIKWVAGVTRMGLIEKKHDMAMLDRIRYFSTLENLSCLWSK